MPDQATREKCWKMMVSCGVLSIRPGSSTMPAPPPAGNDRGVAGRAARIPECPMPARPPIVRWAPRAAVLAMLPALLADCGPARNQFAPPCPGQAILGDAADLNLYRTTGGPGGGADLTDLMLHGRIV